MKGNVKPAIHIEYLPRKIYEWDLEPCKETESRQLEDVHLLLP